MFIQKFGKIGIHEKSNSNKTVPNEPLPRYFTLWS